MIFPGCCRTHPYGGAAGESAIGRNGRGAFRVSGPGLSGRVSGQKGPRAARRVAANAGWCTLYQTAIAARHPEQAGLRAAPTFPLAKEVRPCRLDPPVHPNS
ncbi:hypothetical protein DA2_0548 [Desulfovibrio sp. A2]|nr:hypothetical protein DA2_0548 [Desulfovibrio sp. A2]